VIGRTSKLLINNDKNNRFCCIAHSRSDVAINADTSLDYVLEWPFADAVQLFEEILPQLAEQPMTRNAPRFEILLRYEQLA